MHDFEPFIELADNLNVKIEIRAKTSSIVSFKVGGTASVVAYPSTIEQFVKVLECISLKQYKFYIIGNGTNTFFTDFHYDGIIICTRLLNEITIKDDIMFAQCGALINDCATASCNSSLSGLEFAYGIPGTVGGALCMNASAFCESISSVVCESTVYDMNSRKKLNLRYAEHKFTDKHSVFMNGNFVLLLSKFKLNVGYREHIKSKMSYNLEKRMKLQPLDMPSAGSAFKRPKGDFASRLIDDAGLKGLSVGGAMVSNKHAGFIVNTGNATSKDINDLMSIIQRTVFEKNGIMLEKEIIFVE